MSKNKQYVLDLKFPISFREEDYIVTNSNYLAWNFIKKWPNWGNRYLSNIIYIYSEAGAGKSHLASIWQEASKAQKISKEFLSTVQDFKNQNFVIDDVENFSEYEEQIFNLFNHVVESKSFLLITSRKPLSKLNIKLADLRSRISSIFAIELSKPDDKMVECIIVKYFSDRQITLNTNVIKFLVTRINRSYTRIYSTLKVLETISSSEKRKISIPLIKDVCPWMNR